MKFSYFGTLLPNNELKLLETQPRTMDNGHVHVLDITTTIHGLVIDKYLSILPKGLRLLIYHNKDLWK